MVTVVSSGSTIAEGLPAYAEYGAVMYIELHRGAYVGEYVCTTTIA